MALPEHKKKKGRTRITDTKHWLFFKKKAYHPLIPIIKVK